MSLEEGLLAANRDMLYAALDGMLEGCMIIDREWRYLYVNEVAARHGHAKKEDLVGHTILESYPGVEKTEIFAAYKRCMENRVPEHKEMSYMFPDGSVSWYEFSVSPVPRGIFVLSIDITERKKSEEKLRESEEVFREIFENGQYGIILTGPDSNFIKVNPAYCRMTGYTEAELLTKKFSDITHPENVRADTEAVPKLIRGEIPSYHTEKRYIKKNGEEIWVDLLVSAIRNADGSFGYFLGMVEDITGRRRTELEREAYVTELKEMNRLMIDRELKMVELKKEIDSLKNGYTT